MENSYEKLNYKDKTIHLIKTAHVSKNSKEDVYKYFEEINPDSICIELDEDRYHKLTSKDKWENTDIFKIIKEKKVFVLLINIVLSSYQKRLAKSLDSTSGAEMLAGIELSKEHNKELVLIDRPINITFKRIWQSLTFKEKINMLSGIIEMIFSKEEINEDDINNLKDQNALDLALEEVAKELPNVKKTLVDERDMYLAESIKKAKGNNIMVIIGAAHAKGIQKYINDDINIEELKSLKKSKPSLIKWIIPLFIIGMIVITLILNKDVGLEQIKTWVLVNGTLSAIGTLLCLGHPLSILTAFVMAPITSLNPLLSSGLFAASVEAYVRKPKVKDFEDIAEDTSSFKGFFKNKVTKILLIFIMANLFSAIGTFVSGVGIFSSFIQLFN